MMQFHILLAFNVEEDMLIIFSKVIGLYVCLIFGCYSKKRKIN